MKSELQECFSLLRQGDWAGLFSRPTENGLLQLFRYGFVGGGAFLADFGSYCLFEALGVHYMVAGVLSFLVGFTFNFLVSRILIFRATASAKVEPKELISVLGISIVGMLLTEVLLFMGTEFLRMDFRLSKITASILVLFWNYFARKKFVYR